MKILVGGMIFTGKEFIEGGAIYIENGKIIKVLKRKYLRKEAEIIDCSGKYILPGLIDAHTHIGLYEEGAGRDYTDGNEMTKPVTPHLYAIDAVSPHDVAIKKARENGVTSVFVTPGSANPIGGIGSVIKLKDGLPHKNVVKKEAGMKFAFGENPKFVYGPQKKMPMTRMAIAALIRESLYKAKDYGEKKKRKRDFETDVEMEALLKLLRREFPARAHAHRHDDIMTALRIKEEFGFDLVIEHCTSGAKVKDYLKGKVIGCVVGPAFGVSTKPESRDISFETPRILAKEGILVAITSDHPVTPLKYLNIYAAMAFKEGMEEIEALKAITINPAKILGVEKRIGSIEKGKDADIVVFNRHPFDLLARTEMVFIDGERVK